CQRRYIHARVRSLPTRRSSDLDAPPDAAARTGHQRHFSLEPKLHVTLLFSSTMTLSRRTPISHPGRRTALDNEMIERNASIIRRSEEHTSELQSPDHLVCRILL